MKKTLSKSTQRLWSFQFRNIFSVKMKVSVSNILQLRKPVYNLKSIFEILSFLLLAPAFGRQSDRSRVRTTDKVQKGTRGESPWGPSNWENKNLTRRVTFPPLAYCWSWGLGPPLTLPPPHITSHMVD